MGLNFTSLPYHQTDFNAFEAIFIYIVSLISHAHGKAHFTSVPFAKLSMRVPMWSFFCC